MAQRAPDTAASGRVFGLASFQPAAMTWTDLTWTDLRAAPDSSTSGPWGTHGRANATSEARDYADPPQRSTISWPVEHIERDEDHDSVLAALLLARYSRLAGWQVQLFDAIAPYGDIGLVKLHSTAGGAENLPLA